MIALAAAAWHVTVHPKLVVREGGLLVVNWVVKYWIPWPRIESIETDGQLVIVLTSGATIRPASGGASLASAIGGHRLQRQMRQKIDDARATSALRSPDAPVVRTLDVIVVPFALLAVPFVLYAWLIRT